MKKFLGGNRVIKTGVAVLLTAWICDLLEWPAVFAVITAIVTIEPTVSDSIKKGIVRFPASAIGSAYAVTFISLFGNSPITYALAAVFTISTCYKLNLHAGLLVATLTSVAMIEVIHEHFFIAFLIRLGTTTIGLVVSTFVNMFVLPPDYKDEIFKYIGKIVSLTANMIKQIYTEILDNEKNNETTTLQLTKLENKIDTTSKLIQFQKNEIKYRPFVASETTFFQRMEERIKLFEKMHDKMKFLNSYPFENVNWDEEKVEIIHKAILELTESFLDERKFNINNHYNNKRNIIKIFWNDTVTLNDIADHSTSFPTEIILLYELQAFYDLVEQYYKTFK